MVLGGVWDLFRRHRRKLLVGTALAGTTYAIYQYGRRALRKYEADIMREQMETARRNQHFRANQATAECTVVRLLQPLQTALAREFDCELLTARLRETAESGRDGQDNGATKLETWEKLKVESFARTIAAVYATCLMVVLCKLEVSVLSAHLYTAHGLASPPLEEEGAESGAVDHCPDELTVQVQQDYLSTVSHITGAGLRKLSECVREAVGAHVGSMSLGTPVTLTSLERLTRDVRRAVEECVNGEQSNPVALIKYMLPEEVYETLPAGTSQSQMVLHKLVDETRDVMESGELNEVLAHCVEQGFAHLLDTVAEFLVTQLTPGSSATSDTAHSADGPTPFVNPQRVSVPLAKLVPIITGLSRRVCSERFARGIFRVRTLTEVSSHVYDTFCDPTQPGR